MNNLSPFAVLPSLLLVLYAGAVQAQSSCSSDGQPQPVGLLMSIPEGAKAARLHVVGWVEDARGRIRAIARSRCVPPRSEG